MENIKKIQSFFNNLTLDKIYKEEMLPVTYSIEYTCGILGLNVKELRKGERRVINKYHKNFQNQVWKTLATELNNHINNK